MFDNFTFRYNYKQWKQKNDLNKLESWQSPHMAIRDIVNCHTNIIFRQLLTYLKRFGANLEDESTAPLLVAAWLHDSFEDTSLTRTEVEAQFDFEIAELVWRVTDEPGATHKERKPATYRKTRESKAAIILKLADRIANVESSLASKNSLLRLYRREQDEFKQALKPMSNSEMTQRMWDHLDQLLA